MLGVTLFGIFLTPVFFYVIDWLSQSGPFSSPHVRRYGNYALIFLTAGLLWILLIMRQRLHRPSISSGDSGQHKD
jgi:hypothetical protein